MDAHYIQNLQQLLEATTNPDTNVIRTATAQLNTQYYKSPQCIPALFETSCTHSNVAVRQLAAVELRKRISAADGKLWKKCPAPIRTEIKGSILGRMMQEQAAIVRHALARAVSAIAELELTSSPNGWPTLLPGLYEAATSPQVAYRQTAIFVLFSLLDTITDTFEDQVKDLFTLFAKSLHDPESSEVRITTLRALGRVAETIGAEDKHDIKAFQELIMPMLKVLEQAIQDGDEQAANYGFDVFETFLILDTPLVSKHVGEMTRFFLGVGANKEVEEDIRVGALRVLTWVVTYKKTKVLSLNLIPTIIEGLLPIGLEEDPEEIDEDSPSRIAYRCADDLCQALPPQQVFPVFMNRLQSYLGAADPSHRKSALMFFAVSVEGLSDCIRPHVDEIWPAIEAGLKDPDDVVRKAACFALGCLCEFLSEECATKHSTVVPILFDLIANPKTQKGACTCLDSYLEILGDDIVNYLTLLMERLLVLLEGSAIPVKITVTGAIGSAAHAAKEKFKPYFDETIKRLVPFLSLQGDEEHFNLRGVGIDTIGTIAEAVGAEVFRPYFQVLIKSAFEALTLESTRLKESSFISFGVMAQLFKSEFSPFLQQCVPLLIASCQQSETSDEYIEDEAGNSATAAEIAAAFSTNAGASSSKKATVADEEELGNDEDDDDEDALEKMFANVNSGIAIEKETAIDSLAELFDGTREAFLPYLKESIDVLVDLMDHYYEGIRKAAVGSLFGFIRVSYELSNPQDWVPGGTVVPLHPDVKAMIDLILPKILETWTTEDEKSTAGLICSQLAETMNKVGPALVENCLDTIATQAMEILEKKHLSQQDADVDDENVNTEDNSAYDTVLISSAADVFGAMATILGSEFAQPFGQVLPLIAKYSEPSRSTGEREMAVGCLGEFIVGLKGSVTPYTEALLQIISRGLTDSQGDVRSNAAFAAGVLIENTEHDLSPHYPEFLRALHPYFSPPKDGATILFHAKDNAAGAVSRMILKNPAALPLSDTVAILMNALPLQHDMIENRTVYNAIFSLFRTQPAILQPHLDKLLQAAAWVLLNPEHENDITDETKAELQALIQHLRAEVPDKVAAAGFH